MKTALLFVVGVVVSACGGTSTPSSTPAENHAAPAPAETGSELAQDLGRICNSFELSGAPPDSGMTVAGPWLEKNLRTPEAKALLEDLKKGNMEETRAEAARQNVVPCPLLDPKQP